jgi:hypothetical protein
LYSSQYKNNWIYIFFKKTEALLFIKKEKDEYSLIIQRLNSDRPEQTHQATTAKGVKTEGRHGPDQQEGTNPQGFGWAVSAKKTPGSPPPTGSGIPARSHTAAEDLKQIRQQTRRQQGPSKQQKKTEAGPANYSNDDS